jgi:VanZ family protein
MIAPPMAKSNPAGEFFAPGSWPDVRDVGLARDLLRIGGLLYRPMPTLHVCRADCYNSPMLYLRVLSAAYWALLTLLLLVPDPAAIFFNVRPASVAAGMGGMHFTSFLVLALLVQAARFPVRPRVQWAVLVGYALVVESLQWFVPQRCVDPADYTENLLGLAAGAILFWAVTLRRRVRNVK